MEKTFLLIFLSLLPYTESATSLFHACTATSECTTQATCDKTGYEKCAKGRCKCPTGYFQSGSVCKQYLSYGQDCSNSAKTQCKSPFTCKNNKCDCATSYEVNPSDNTKCIWKDRKNIGEACTSHTQCRSGSKFPFKNKNYNF